MSENLDYYADSGMDVEEVQCNFDFLDPRPDFSISSRPFLNNLASPNFPISVLADYICDQPEVGTYVVADNGEKPEDAIIGFITLINLNAVRITQENPAVHALANYINAHTQIRESLTGSCAVLINTRVANFPSELVPHLHTQLVQDVEWARSNSPDAHLFNIDTVVVLTKCVKNHSSVEVTRKKRKAAQMPETVFIKPEESILFSHSEAHVTYPSELGHVTAAGMTPQAPIHFSEDSSMEKMVTYR